MVPDKFNMVDMGGIDLIMMQGEAVPGLYEKLMAAISNCRYQCLYNWLFDAVLIPPTYVQLEDIDSEVYLNEGVSVTSDDVIHIYSVEPGPVDPEIIPLLVEENGTYTAPSGVDGYSPVMVNVSGGSDSTILHETAYQTSGAFSYSKEITIPKTSTYKITVQSYSNGFTLKINGVTQPYTANQSSRYTYLFYGELSLNIGDIITLSCTSSGVSIVTFVITDMN